MQEDRTLYAHSDGNFEDETEDYLEDLDDGFEEEEEFSSSLSPLEDDEIEDDEEEQKVEESVAAALSAPPAKRAAPRKAPAKKATAKKAAPKRTPAKKAAARKAVPKRTPAQKAAVKKAAPKKAATKPSQSARLIFISYRRQDSQHITGRIYDRLSTQFGKSAVFKDVDSIPLGFDFRDHIREQVSCCSVLVAVIGKNWNGSSASGDRRLSDHRDHLRIEIEAALERRIPVIPVLVDNVDMPTEAELPPSLGRLAYHHGIVVRPDPDFHNDVSRLAQGIESLLKNGPSSGLRTRR